MGATIGEGAGLHEEGEHAGWARVQAASLRREGELLPPAGKKQGQRSKSLRRRKAGGNTAYHRALLEAFVRSLAGNRPGEDVILLTVLPVLPRIVRWSLDGGGRRFAASGLNDLLSSRRGCCFWQSGEASAADLWLRRTSS